MLQALGDYAGAKAQYEQALSSGLKTYGPDHPQVALYRNNLGLVLQALGDYAGAKAQIEKALAIFTRLLGPTHPSTRTVRANLAGVEQKLNATNGNSTE